MTKKRKYVTAEKIENSGPVEVVVEDVTSHPLCLHGPTLLFASPKGRYFACSACRNKKDCTVHIEEEEWKKEGVKKRNEKYYSIIPKINKEAAWKNLQEVRFLKLLKTCPLTVYTLIYKSQMRNDPSIS